MLLSNLFLFATGRFITPNEASTLKNVPVYQRDVDNPSCASEDILGAVVLQCRQTRSF